MSRENDKEATTPTYSAAKWMREQRNYHSKYEVPKPPEETESEEEGREEDKC